MVQAHRDAGAAAWRPPAGMKPAPTKPCTRR